MGIIPEQILQGLLGNENGVSEPAVILYALQKSSVDCGRLVIGKVTTFRQTLKQSAYETLKIDTPHLTV